ncbi:hypothetical protein [Nocardioides lianchengensis]|uniref:hypothetical protein n=1 Tax=Nocardioides lianchengensis TaxID=1045774 RepID=UPI000B85F69D|nr:hypothetical protein [Nocardioides lianchengensis]NYG09641.1 hypothetical protein [Nocardioides lianchengensis]
MEDWRREVFRSRTLKDHAKVVLLDLADQMRADLRVSVPRETIAKRVGKSERGVTRSISDAHEAGFLDTVVSGRKYVTAVYAATFPSDLRATHGVPLRTEEEAADGVLSGTFFSPLRTTTSVPLRTPIQALSGTHAVPPIEERTCPVGPTDRNVGSKERAEGHVVRFPATGCRWHEHLCPDDCADHPDNREASA